jgi:hypothetical protein
VSQPDSAPGGTASGTTPSPGLTGPGVTPTPGRALPTDPAELEAEIERTRQRLVGTVDELAGRLKPKAMAKRSADDLRTRVDAAIRTPDGSLRVERLAAIAAALAALASLVVWNRRRLHR